MRRRLKLNKILVPTDFSDLSLGALQHAAAMARYTEGSIELLHVIEPHQHNELLGKFINVSEVLEKAVNEKLEKVKKEQVSLWTIPISAKVVIGNIHDEIERTTEQDKIDLIVMGTHGAAIFDDLTKYILGSNAYKTVHVAKCPVVTIRDPKEKVQFKNIVLPLDTTKETKQKVNAAISIAKTYNSTVHVISVSTFFEEFSHNLSELSGQLQEVAQVLKSENINVKTKMIRHDDVADSVMEYSEEAGADLILIMVREESNLDKVTLGGRARKIIAESKTPVMSMRPSFVE